MKAQVYFNNGGNTVYKWSVMPSNAAESKPLYTQE